MQHVKLTVVYILTCHSLNELVSRAGLFVNLLCPVEASVGHFGGICGHFLACVAYFWTSIGMIWASPSPVEEPDFCPSPALHACFNSVSYLVMSHLRCMIPTFGAQCHLPYWMFYQVDYFESWAGRHWLGLLWQGIKLKTSQSQGSWH